MGERILEIVFYLVRHARSHDGTLARLEDVSRSLKNLGFSDTEISSAYGWLLEEVQLRDNQSLINPRSIKRAPRLFSEVEKQVFSVACRGFLIQLYQLGLIDFEQFEAIIDRVQLLEPSSIDLATLKLISASVVFSRINKNWDLNWFNLSGEETVN